MKRTRNCHDKKKNEILFLQEEKMQIILFYLYDEFEKHSCYDSSRPWNHSFTTVPEASAAPHESGQSKSFRIENKKQCEG